MDKIFYKNLKLFLKDLIVVFPEDDEALQILSTSINLAIIDDDDHKIIKKFYNCLSPFEQEINQRNILFFSSSLSENWNHDAPEYRLFSKINANWDTFSDHNKNILWDYIQCLFTLSKTIIES
jgi:hypothetical protein